MSLTQVPEEELLLATEDFTTVSKAAGPASFRFRLACVLLQTVFVTLNGLIVVGYQALLPVMLRSNAYKHVVCTLNMSESECLDLQTLRLNLMSTIALGGLNISMAISGTIQRFLGPRRLAWVGAVLFASGLVIFAEAPRLLALSVYLDGFIAGYLIIALGGAAVLLSSLHTANHFPRQRGTITSMYMASENVGSGVFLVFQMINTNTGASLEVIFLSYLALPVLFTLFAAYFQPKEALIASSENEERLTETYETQTWRSKQFLMMVLWGPLGLTYSYFYLNNLLVELQWLQQDAPNANAEATFAAYVFSFMFMGISILAVIVVGLIVDKLGMFASMLFSATMTALWGTLSVLNVIPLYSQYITMVAFIMARQSLLGVWSHYANVIFGVNATHYLGISFTVAGFCILSTYGWTALAHSTGTFLPINIGFTIVNCVLSLVMAIACWKWRMKT